MPPPRAACVRPCGSSARASVSCPRRARAAPASARRRARAALRAARGLTTRSRSTATASEAASSAGARSDSSTSSSTTTSAPHDAVIGRIVSSTRLTSSSCWPDSTAESTASAAASARTGTSNVTSMTGRALGRRARLRDGTPVAAREPHSGTRFQLRVLCRVFSRRPFAHLRDTNTRVCEHEHEEEEAELEPVEDRERDEDRREHERRAECEQAVPTNARRRLAYSSAGICAVSHAFPHVGHVHRSP